MERAERVKKMEEILNRQTELQEKAEEFFIEWQKSQPEFRELMDYYFEGEWRDDYDNVDSDELKNISKGVLSQDLVYNLFSDRRDLAFRVMRAGLDFLEK